LKHEARGLNARRRPFYLDAAEPQLGQARSVVPSLVVAASPLGDRQEIADPRHCYGALWSGRLRHRRRLQFRSIGANDHDYEDWIGRTDRLEYPMVLNPVSIELARTRPHRDTKCLAPRRKWPTTPFQSNWHEPGRTVTQSVSHRNAKSRQPPIDRSSSLESDWGYSATHAMHATQNPGSLLIFVFCRLLLNGPRGSSSGPVRSHHLDLGMNRS
jgi:hypothetical protein